MKLSTLSDDIPLLSSVNFDFISSIGLLKLTPFDFQKNKKWLLYEYNVLFLSETDLGYTSLPLKYPLLILLALEKSRILALVMLLL